MILADIARFNNLLTYLLTSTVSVERVIQRFRGDGIIQHTSPPSENCSLYSRLPTHSTAFGEIGKKTGDRK